MFTKNGSAALDDEGNPITVTVTGEGNTWNWSFINLPVWDGITENVYSISEDITVDGYEVTITQDETTGEYTITNTYSYEASGDVTLAATKTYTGAELTEGLFSFTITETTDPENENPYTKTVTNGADGSISFTKIEYTLDDVGTHTYVIAETAGTASGVTYDSNTINVTVVVADAGDGTLTTNVIVEGNEVAVGSDGSYNVGTFENSYEATGNVTLTATKTISGRSSTVKSFNFTLYNSDENFTYNIGDTRSSASTTGTLTEGEAQTVTFPAITYTEADTYYFVIIESSTGTEDDGWTYDSTEYHVTVMMTDNGNGNLIPSVTYEYMDENEETQTGNAAAFTNTYAATGSLSLSGTKTFTGGDITDGQFTYTVMEGETQVATGTVAADGTITFTQIDYTYSDAGEHIYTITEDAGSDTSVQYDKTEYTVVVTVTDNETGELAVSYTVDGVESGSIAFTNYQKGSLTINKTFTGLTNEQITSLTDFTIIVTNSNDDTVATLTLDDADEDNSYIWTISNLPADTYTVTETGYSLDGYEVIAKSGAVTVTDGLDISVNEKLAWGGEDTIEFTNDYTEVGTITISKYVVAEEDIQEAHEDTEYTVAITASPSDAEKEIDFQWVTVKSDSGREITPKIEGKTISFTITEDETVTIDGLPAGEYTVEETGSDAVTSESFIPVYIVGEDETEEAPTVTVASGSENVVAVVIENEYPIGTYIMVQKDYNKDEYPEEGFTFTIEALSCDLEAEDVTLTADKMPMPNNISVTITESDKIGYFGHIGINGENDDDIYFEHLGTYYYKITETPGSDESIVYDSSVHYIKVVVSSAEGTYVEITDEYEAKAPEETDDYKDLYYEEARIVTAKFTNTALEELSIEKEVSGNAGDTSDYEFEITLTNSDGTPFEGSVTMTSSNSDEEKTITFEDGEVTVTITADETVTLMVPYGVTCTITEVGSDADSVNVSVNGVYQAQSTTTEATADLGTIADSTQVKFVNSYRAYYPIDEEIVTDTDDIFDRDAWVKDEAVNEYNAIEIEMTTNLPVVTAYDLANGEFTMNFHEVLDHELVLDEDTADFSVYIGETAISTAYYRITFDDDTGDDCNFHVDVDLTALYNDGIVTEDMLDGNTEITIFFFADLEGTGLNGSYTSTVWYDIYDGDEWLYTAEPSVVEVYTYEIKIFKYDSETGDALAGATLGIYYDKECSEAVSRNGKDYTETSGDDGMVIFYGLADGTYYVSEIKAPNGYILSDEVLIVELGEALNNSGYAFTGEFANTPGPKINIEGSKTWDDNNDQDGDRPASITIRLLADGKEIESKVVTAADGWSWSFLDLDVYDEDGNEITYTIMEDSIDDYSATYDGYDVTNTHTPGKTSLSVTKAWNDANDVDGIRPNSITVELLKNGEATGNTLVLSAANNWIGTFTNLDMYTDGERNDYSVTEVSVSGYSTAITGDTSKGYAITNTHTPNNNGGDGGTGGTSGGRHSSSGGGGGGSSTRSTGVSAGGPGTGESEGEGDIWNLLPLAQTGEPLDMLFGTLTLAISAMSLIVLLFFKKKWEIE